MCNKALPLLYQQSWIPLDFFKDFWHHKDTMQKIEKWRIQELTQVLNQISILLREGKNAEWANVFSHFAQEANKISEKRELKLDYLIRLIQNIMNCFDGGSSLQNLILQHENSNRMARLNLEFNQSRELLSEIFAQMETKLTEPIN